MLRFYMRMVFVSVLAILVSCPGKAEEDRDRTVPVRASSSLAYARQFATLDWDAIEDWGEDFKAAEPEKPKPPRPIVTGAKQLIPYAATRTDTVEAMLWLAEVSSEDIVYDLGSGDGRICIAAVRDFGAKRAVGIEKNAEKVAESRAKAKAAGVSDRVTFIEGDLFETDFSEATVVTLYLGNSPNIRLRPVVMQRLQPGTYIVSHYFGMGEWPPDKKFYGRRALFGMYSGWWNEWEDCPFVPRYEGYETHPYAADSALAWRIPAPIAGVWKGTRETEHGTLPLELVFHQSLASLKGSGNLFDETEVSGRLTVDLWGSEVRMNQNTGDAEGTKFSYVLDGKVEGNQIHGNSVRIVAGAQETWPWTAQREPVDFTGKWVWEMEEVGDPVTLEIAKDAVGHQVHVHWWGERHDITDFYDFGGGFYLTKFVEPKHTDRGALRYPSGYLVGEAIVRDDELTGTIAFYPGGDWSSNWGPSGLTKYDFIKFQRPWTATRVVE